MIYNKDNPLRVVTLCSGYDSQCLALNKLKDQYHDFDYELVAWSEFDPESKTPLERQPAVLAHNALFPQWGDRNLGDMTKIDWTKIGDFDFLFYSTPCQSISQAGLQHGFIEGSGTRSSIIWNVRDAVTVKRPKYLCLENVKAIISRKFIGVFNLWQKELEHLGYVNFAAILNAKDYGIPQNRERLFLISIRIDNDRPRFYFPEPFPLEKKLKDILEENVNEKYYLSDTMISKFSNGGENPSLPKELKGKKFRIRRLTPRECFRLMGVSNEDIDKIQASGVSNSAQYKLAGNSIVAGGNYKDKHGNMDGVLYNIFRKMFIETRNESQQFTLF